MNRAVCVWGAYLKQIEAHGPVPDGGALDLVLPHDLHQLVGQLVLKHACDQLRREALWARSTNSTAQQAAAWHSRAYQMLTKLDRQLFIKYAREQLRRTDL